MTGSLTVIEHSLRFHLFLCDDSFSHISVNHRRFGDQLNTHRPLHDVQPNIHTLKHGCIEQSLLQGLQVIVSAPMATLMFRHSSYIMRSAISFDPWLLE